MPERPGVAKADKRPPEVRLSVLPARGHLSGTKGIGALLTVQDTQVELHQQLLCRPIGTTPQAYPDQQAHGQLVRDAALLLLDRRVLPSDAASVKGPLTSPVVAGCAPKAIHTQLQRLEPPAKPPHLSLIRGLQAIEYRDAMDAREFQSRWPAQAFLQYQAKVVRQPYGAGTKNEQEAVVLLTPQGSLKLRRLGGNPFRDTELEKLVGREIDCDGDIHHGQLLMTRWNVVATT